MFTICILSKYKLDFLSLPARFNIPIWMNLAANMQIYTKKPERENYIKLIDKLSILFISPWLKIRMNKEYIITYTTFNLFSIVC